MDKLGNADSNTGSARDDGDGGTLGKLNKPKSASIESIVSTLLPVLIYTSVCVLIFWVLRRRMARVYAPRAHLRHYLPQERSLSPSKGWFDWVRPFIKEADVYILNHSSLDAFLFLRYLKLLSFICFIGCCLSWPVLMPIHATGGGGLTQLDSATIGNVTNPKHYFFHVAVAYIYFGFILFTVYRECIYYINLRHAYLLSPYYSKRLSSRTVLFQCVPDKYLDAHRLRKVFGDSVKHVWLVRDTSDLEHMVDERDETALRLEKAEIRLIKLANAARLKGQRSAPAQPWFSLPPQWVPASHRPGHRPLGNFLRRVDTIKWTRNRLKLLMPQIAKLRRKLHAGSEGRLLGSVFIEFQTQSDAQRAYQTLAHDRPMHMSPRFIGIRPDEVVWHSLRIGWFARMVRRVAMLALIIAAIVFWVIPAGAVGIMSNITFLAENFVFLRWLTMLPAPVTGVIQGFLPALALSLLMAIVPWLLRGCARVAGEPSLSEIELYVQNFYFAFQVIQVFLVTTMTSAASAALGAVIKDPTSIPDLLSKNLPKASNFYLSYILIQCLAVGATGLLHLWDLIRHGIMTRFIQNPRSKWRIYKLTRPIHWGGWFPVFTNMAVIAFSYACIAPVILGFASVGMYVIYIISKYNFLFVEDSSIDTRGLVYPRALKHLLFGVYLAQACLIGLFALQGAYAPMMLMIVSLVISLIFHISISEALSPLLANLPRTLALEIEELTGDGEQPMPLPAFDIDPASIPLPLDQDEEDEDETVVHETTGARGLARSMGMEGSPSLAKFARRWTWDAYVRKVSEFLHEIGLGPILDRIDAIVNPVYSPNPSAIMRFLHPNTFDSFAHLRQMIPDDLPDPTATYPEDYIFKAYYPPEMWTPTPRLWLPRDDAGVSTQEIDHCKRYGRIVASDEGAWLGEDGVIRCEVDEAPFWEDRALY
ncbi:phosphate metabolism protein [Plectosphaerella plurivora]|uniref:Phosphate metabolism protein n=1 Tax=Plectosphaerella plurivora TaxID=936078 RepID=A0A9P8VHK8_9PEZI|nr:phosphate metabolism protein [Plectosphaerella plurivora]